MMSVAYVPASETRQTGPGLNWMRMKKYLARRVNVVMDVREADVVHVNSDWSASRVDVYHARGGWAEPCATVYGNINKAKRIIACSRWLAAVLCPHKADITTIVPNGVDPDDWIGVRVYDGGYVLAKCCSVMGWELDILLQAARLRHDLEFVIVGGGIECEIPQNVRIVSHLPFRALRHMIAGCSMFISPAIETFGTMVLEAWYCRKPVLALGIGGGAELVGPEAAAGKLYYSSEELADLMSDVRSEHGDNGHEIVVNRYLWSSLADRVVSVYEGIVSGH